MFENNVEDGREGAEGGGGQKFLNFVLDKGSPLTFIHVAGGAEGVSRMPNNHLCRLRAFPLRKLFS